MLLLDILLVMCVYASLMLKSGSLNEECGFFFSLFFSFDGLNEVQMASSSLNLYFNLPPSFDIFDWLRLLFNL